MRAVGILRKMYGVLTLYITVLLLFTFIIFIATFDIAQNTYDSKEYYNYNYSSWFKIFNTLLLAITTNNTPDLAVGDPNHRTLYVAFYVGVTCFNLIMANGLILAIINQKYREIFEEEFNDDKRLNEQQKMLME